jgi:hypothetical protein
MNQLLLVPANTSSQEGIVVQRSEDDQEQRRCNYGGDIQIDERTYTN